MFSKYIMLTEVTNQVSVYPNVMVGLTSDGTNLYASAYYLFKINSTILNSYTTLNSAPNGNGYASYFYNGYIYFVDVGSGAISKYSSIDGTGGLFYAFTNPRGSSAIIVLNDYIYISMSDGDIYKIDINDSTKAVKLNISVTQANSITGDSANNILYLVRPRSITSINLNAAILTETFIVNPEPDLSYTPGIIGSVFYKGYLFYSLQNKKTGTINGSIGYVNLSDSTNVNNWIVNDKLDSPCGLAIANNNLYVANYGNRMIVKITNLPYVIPCFKEDSKILTDKGYLPIQDLKKGDLVKTLKHGFVPIHLIGKKVIYHSASQERIRNQLYKYDQNAYPEVFEDLVLTGCHSVLVDEFVSEEQREKTIHVNGDTYVTDDKYRLPACADDKAIVYEPAGNYTIYHFALENEDYYMNYGVYANGLLVETTSIRFLKELSDFSFLKI